MSFNVDSIDTSVKNHFTFDDFSTEDEFSEKPMMMPRMDADGADGSSSEPLSTSETAIRAMEEEQEMLTSSLMSLTSHFAQVQLRLRQIMEAPPEERDQLLKGLEEFAFQGIPELNIPPEMASSDNLLDTAVEEQGTRQRELIDTLKSQLEELEKYAYESGVGILPQSILLEKQKVIIDEFKSKINLNLDETDLPQLSPDDLKKQVDSALGEFVSPLKMKEQLVTQLKTQITDLERFIKFLQTEGFEKKMMAKGKFNTDLKCECKNVHLGCEETKTSVRRTHESSSNQARPQDTLNGKAISLLDKAATMLQFFAMSQFGCTSQRFQMNTLKKTHKGNHWGDLRAQLEVDVQEVLSIVKETSKLLVQERNEQSRKKRNNSTSSQESQDKSKHKYLDPELIALSAELTTTVRKRLAMSIQKLMEHGLRGVNEQTSLVPFIGCFSHVRSDYDDFFDGSDGTFREMHAWELILEYYHIKNGEQYNETPARKLSQSFNLDIGAGNAQSTKQSLLSAVGTVLAIHCPYKRSYNAHFKAFISAALK